MMPLLNPEGWLGFKINHMKVGNKVLYRTREWHVQRAEGKRECGPLLETTSR